MNVKLENAMDQIEGYCLVSKSKADVLKDRRLFHRLTQKQVADRAKISLQQYQKFESGARNIMTCSFQIACRVIEALNMDVAKFYHGDYDCTEPVYIEDGVLRYRETGRPIDEEPEEDERSKSDCRDQSSH